MHKRSWIHSIGFLLALLAQAGCDLTEPTPLEPDPSPSVLGEWILTATFDGWTASADTSGIRPGTERRSGITCRQEGRLVVTEQKPNGALSWSLDRTTTCTPPSDDFKASDHFADTWERYRWGSVQDDSVEVRTPFPGLFPDHSSCTYAGTIKDRPPSRLAGDVTCSWYNGLSCMLFSPCGLSYYQGTWEARRPQ